MIWFCVLSSPLKHLNDLKHNVTTQKEINLKQPNQNDTEETIVLGM